MAIRIGSQAFPFFRCPSHQVGSRKLKPPRETSCQVTRRAWDAVVPLVLLPSNVPGKGFFYPAYAPVMQRVSGSQSQGGGERSLHHYHVVLSISARYRSDPRKYLPANLVRVLDNARGVQ